MASTTDPDVIQKMPPPRLSVAPMVAVTTRQHRYFTRLLSRSTTLYTEMIVAESLVYGKDQVIGEFLDPCAEGPVVLQLAGRNVENVSIAVQKAQSRGFSEINLNCGCPSKKAAVNGAFGLAMMKEPELVSEIVRTAKRVSDIPITVKCRLGVDKMDSYEHVSQFVAAVLNAGADRVSVHARKGVLGLNTKNNRSIPPLKYDWVYRLCQDFSGTRFDLNGGVISMEEARARVIESEHRLDGIMMGRSIWRDPLLLADVDSSWFGKTMSGLPQTRRGLLEAFCERFDGKPDEFPVFETTEALQGLFLGTKCASTFRKTMAKQRKGESLSEILQRVYDEVSQEVLDEPIRGQSVTKSTMDDQNVQEATVVSEGRKAVTLSW